MKIVENEAMKSRLGTRTCRQFASSISPGTDARHHREVAGHERKDAGGEERYEPRDEGDGHIRA